MKSIESARTGMVSSNSFLAATNIAPDPRGAFRDGQIFWNQLADTEVVRANMQIGGTKHGKFDLPEQ